MKYVETRDDTCNELKFFYTVNFINMKIFIKIYVKKELKPFCKNSIFEKLLNRLTTEHIFSANIRLVKQIGGCLMGGAISVVLSDICLCKMKEDVMAPSKPLFYKGYVHDTKKKWNWWTLQCIEVVPPKYKTDLRIGFSQVPWYRDYSK